MEDSIAAFCSQLKDFCTHIHSISSRLRNAVDRKGPSPIFNSDSSSFLRSLGDRAAFANQRLNALEAMTIDTVSTQELLGHCMELYKQNEKNISILEEQLTEYGYKPMMEGENAQFMEPSTPITRTTEDDSGFQFTNCNTPRLSLHQAAAYPNRVYEDTDLSFCLTPASKAALNLPIRDLSDDDDLLSGLQDLGLSAASLACLARDDASSQEFLPTTSLPVSISDVKDASSQEFLPTTSLPVSISDVKDQSVAACVVDMVLEDEGAYSLMKKVEEEEYNEIPSWLKEQVSLQNLNAFISKVTVVLRSKSMNRGYLDADCDGDLLDAEDLISLNAETNVKAYLLMLVRIGRIRTECKNGSLVYRLSKQ